MENKRHKQANSSERLESSIPPRLRKSLDLVAMNFNNSRMRNLDIMHTKDELLYGQMTHYEGNNFCWIQPSLVRNKHVVDIDYDKYIRRANSRGKAGKLLDMESIEIGIDCLARYEVDNHWYRAIVVDGPVTRDNDWLLFFVDYGNFQVTNRCRMNMPLDEPVGSHYHAPLQAVCCHLYNVVPRLPFMRPEIDSRLEKFFVQNVNNFMDVKVRAVRPDFIVDCDLFMVDPNTKLVGEDRLYRHHIGQPIVDDGLACFDNPELAYSVKQ